MTELPSAVEPLLADYRTLLERELPGLMAGLYVHGSIALEAFNPGFSDVDFITVVSRRCNFDDLQRLAKIHQQLHQHYPRPPLEGSYLQWPDLGKFEDAIPPSPCFHDRQLHPAGHHDVNAVTWWVLKHRGLTLVGPEPADLDFSVDWDMLMDRMRANLNTY
ncbi:MAG: nucleotidyltransferase domain-containing protein [Anaerolineae bacterium]|nr:nucleotidyltransferase domain-containing protein [Anaerolineae bacterium]